MTERNTVLMKIWDQKGYIKNVKDSPENVMDVEVEIAEFAGWHHPARTSAELQTSSHFPLHGCEYIKHLS